MKITNDTTFEIVHFEGEHPDTTLWSYNAVKIDGKWCAGMNEAVLRVSDEKGFSAHFANEHTASEYIKHIKTVNEKVVVSVVEVIWP